jgi:DNA repair photolyase
MKADYKSGRGAQINTHNPFEKNRYTTDPAFKEHLHQSGEDTSGNTKTTYTAVYPKTILNRVSSPDIGKTWSLNPYQGCEHGCAYCYARNSHEYWGYSAGTDFEQKILVKKNAPQLLEKTFQKSSWHPEPIMLSGNTDCYQPIEKKLQITRSILKVLEKYQHPVGIITKNALIQRDIDILKRLAENQLVKVSLSVTTLNEDLRRKLEPRTASVKRRLQTIALLAQNDIPVNIMFAPVIPGLNSHETMAVAEACSQAGAAKFSYTVVRLNGRVAPLFMNWVQSHFPDRFSKIKKGIEEMHGGQLNDSAFGRRMGGAGPFAEQLQQTVALARKKYFSDTFYPDYNCADFLRLPKGQFSLGF